MTEPKSPTHAAPDLFSTMDLLARAQQGEAGAVNSLVARYRPRLERWASGRLPHFARSLFDTGDLIQETLLKAVEKFSSIRAGDQGSFEGYARRSILNRIRDQIRYARRRPPADGLEDLVDPDPSPLEQAIGEETVGRYERALEQLSEEDRGLIHLRVELGLDYEEIARISGRPSPDAVRMGIKRAIFRLAERMKE